MMSMHLVRGMSSLNSRKRKVKREPGWKQRLDEHEEYLKSLGVTDKKTDYRYDMPDYSTGPRMTSDRVAGNGTKKDSMRYTGNEIMGIANTHKSNAMPIRRDNKQAAIDAAQMRRS
jgi:hypothetical protein